MNGLFQQDRSGRLPEPCNSSSPCVDPLPGRCSQQAAAHLAGVFTGPAPSYYLFTRRFGRYLPVYPKFVPRGHRLNGLNAHVASCPALRNSGFVICGTKWRVSGIARRGAYASENDPGTRLRVRASDRQPPPSPSTTPSPGSLATVQPITHDACSPRVRRQ